MDENNSGMSNDNYKLILERLDSQDKKIEALEKENKDIASMNRALMFTKESSSPAVSKDEEHKMLEKKLKEALKYA